MSLAIQYKISGSTKCNLSILSTFLEGHYDLKTRVSLVPAKRLGINPVLADLIGPVDKLTSTIDSLQQSEKINLINR